MVGLWIQGTNSIKPPRNQSDFFPCVPLVIPQFRKFPAKAEPVEFTEFSDDVTLSKSSGNYFLLFLTLAPFEVFHGPGGEGLQGEALCMKWVFVSLVLREVFQ